MPSKTLLLTGATGFVGSHVVEAVANRGHEVRALVRPSSRLEILKQHGIETVPGTLEDANSVRRAVEGVDTIVHMAAATRAANEAEFQRVNAIGTRTLVEAVAAASSPPKRVLYLSSLAAVGPSFDGRPVDASVQPRPLTAYGRTKLEGERLCSALPVTVELVILRAAAVYGPRDRDIYEFFKLADRAAIPVPTGPVRKLQLIHASDLARAIVDAATGEGARGVYHIAESRAYEWREMAALVAAAVGKKPRLIPVPAALISIAGAFTETVSALIGKPSIFSRDKARELLAPGWLCETERARQDFGFEAAIPLAAGLANTAAWYRAEGWL